VKSRTFCRGRREMKEQRRKKKDKNGRRGHVKKVMKGGRSQDTRGKRFRPMTHGSIREQTKEKGTRPSKKPGLNGRWQPQTNENPRLGEEGDLEGSCCTAERSGPRKKRCEGDPARFHSDVPKEERRPILRQDVRQKNTEAFERRKAGTTLRNGRFINGAKNSPVLHRGSRRVAKNHTQGRKTRGMEEKAIERRDEKGGA